MVSNRMQARVRLLPDMRRTAPRSSDLAPGLKILGDLQKLNLEHSDYWSDDTMVRIYGDASREFRV